MIPKDMPREFQNLLRFHSWPKTTQDRFILLIRSLYGAWEEDEGEEESTSPICQQCGRNPAIAQTTDWGWLCGDCWNALFVSHLRQGVK